MADMPRNNIVPLTPRLPARESSHPIPQSDPVPRATDIIGDIEAQTAYYKAERAQTASMLREAQSIVKKPSFFLYFFLFYLAVVIDVWGVVQLLFDATGIGLIIVTIINIIFGCVFWCLAFLIGRPIKKMDRIGKRTSDAAQQTVQKIASMRTRYASAIKFSRKVKVLRKPVRKIALMVRKFTKKTRSPLIKMGIAEILEVIPLIELAPWQTLAVYSMYKDHRSAYLDGLEQLQYLQETLAAQDEEFNESQVQEYEQLLAQTTAFQEETESIAA